MKTGYGRKEERRWIEGRKEGRQDIERIYL